MNLAEDIKFAEDNSDELTSMAAILRYVAAINPEATREQFVAACVAAGYAANTSANRFRESRKVSMQMAADCDESATLENDGRITYHDKQPISNE